MKRILVVGAGGFTGGFIVGEGLRRGYEVWAGVRASTSRAFLQDSRIHFLELDFQNRESLSESLRGALPEGERWDYIIYNLGATKALDFASFNRVNHDYLRDFTSARAVTGMTPGKILYMSSLSVMGAGDEKGYTPFTPRDIPQPNTRYGASKLKAEMCLASSGLPYVIFRCTGIYGPRERDYYLMFKSISRGFDFSVGFRRQMLTFIYVGDLAKAVYDALEKAPAGRTYVIAEGRSYTQREFRSIAARELGRRHVLPVVAPLWVLRAVCGMSGLIGRFRHKAMTLNPDKYRIMRQRNWNADIEDARRDFGFNPRTSLELGVRNAVAWYREAGWL